MVFLKEFFKKVNFEKIQQTTKNHEKLPSMQRVYDFSLQETWDLENLLNECTVPSQPQGRVKVIPHLLEALDNLRFAQLQDDVDNGNRLI